MTPNGVEYVRTFPDQDGEDTENKFMRAVIDRYALEKKTDKGAPSGQFFMNKKMTMELGKDCVEKTKDMHSKELDEYVAQYFPRTWEHFDVNKVGMLDALDMTAFCKYLASDQSVDLDNLFK